jgi:hypothetical protein
VARPSGPLEADQAERWVLELMNRDREAEGLAPLEWDPVAARAGRAHAEDMARNGFTAHWGTDGSFPELRHTEAGGEHMVQENAGCFADGKPRELDPRPRFAPEAVERVHAAFIGEVPPRDGHRRNILKPFHTHAGVGLAKAKGLEVVCMAQELTDHYGAYDPVPRRAKIGQRVQVQGTVAETARFVGVGVARVDLPARRSPKELARTGTYPIPAPFVTYFPRGFVTPKPVEVQGKSFSIELLLGEPGKPGVYEVSVWAEVPGWKDYVMVSLRTVRVE